MLKSSNQIWFKWFFKSDVTKCSNLIWFKLDLRGDLKGLEHNLKIRSGQGLENGFEMNSSRGPYGGFHGIRLFFQPGKKICLQPGPVESFANLSGTCTLFCLWILPRIHTQIRFELKSWQVLEKNFKLRFGKGLDGTCKWIIRYEQGLKNDVKPRIGGTNQWHQKYWGKSDSANPFVWNLL